MRALPTIVRRPLGRGRRGAIEAYRRATGGRMLPTFLIIGAQKAGTTSLYELLAEHPEVGRASDKEVHYFDLQHDRPLDWYRAHFARHGEARHTGEATPYYMFHPACPERIHRVLPDIKLIVLLRNPAERAYSHHNHERALGHERLDFASALAQEPQRLQGEAERLMRDPSYRSFAHQHYSYLSRGRYGEQLHRWYQHFPREQILILASEDLFSHPVRTVHQVQAWLNLPPHTPETLAPRNARTYDPLDAELRGRLIDYFSADVEEVSRLTSVRLPWAP